jgi:hypothetical protein
VALDDAVEDILADLAPIFDDTVSFGPVELWQVVVTDLGGGEFSVVENYLDSYKPTNVAGTHVNPPVPAAQTIITFRSLEGGILRLDLQDTSIAPAAEQTFPTSNASINAIADAFVHSLSIVLAKDTSYLVVPKAYFPGQNEAAWKRINRASTQ